MDITNMSQLRPALEGICDEVVEEVTEKAYNSYRDLIESTVYGAGQPKVYERTHQFYESWLWRKNSTMKTEIYQDPSIMDYNPDMMQHGSQQQGDTRQYLADYIYNGVIDGLFGDGWWTYPRDAFGEATTEIKAALRAWVVKAFADRGVVCKSSYFWA